MYVELTENFTNPLTSGSSFTNTYVLHMTAHKLFFYLTRERFRLTNDSGHMTFNKFKSKLVVPAILKQYETVGKI